MAKRRNLKKEKAARNQAYARQFRKQSNRSFSKGKRFSGRSRNTEDAETDKDENSGTHANYEN